MTELRRAVGLRTVVSTGAGMALATVTYVSFIELASYLAGNSSWIAILTAGIMAILAGSCFAELNSMYPTAAGIKLFIEKAFGEKAAIIISGVYVLGQLSIIGAEIFILSQGISQGFPAINPLVFAAFFILIIFYLNLRGIKFAGATQDIMGYVMFAGLIAVSLYGFYRIDFQFSNPFEIGTFDGFIQAVAIGISCFIAFEWVITILTSINAGLMTSSRFLYAMARDWSLPKFMARLHPAYATPWVALVIVTLYCVAVTAFGFITRYILCMILIIAAAE
ncbi:MAG: amino acid permease, partial [Proteobacteria bacterium]|nr:amino acid permease [Pseudomonadota bacterium]